MSAKHTATQKPDADGYLRSGIYKQYVGPAKSIPFTEEAARELVKKLNQPAEEWITSSELWLADCLRHYGVEGVIDSKHIPLLTRDLDEQARDAVAALHTIRVLRVHLGPTGNSDMLARKAFELGRLVEKIQMQQFEGNVLTGKRHQES